MKNGYELVYGGWLASGNWRGELDFLEINKTVKSNFGDWSYEIIDTKNTSKVKKDHIYQISLYSFLLKEAQGILPKNFYILLKDKKKKSLGIGEVYDIFLEQKLSFENFVKNDLNRKKLEKVSYCSFRDLQEFCEKEWINKKHLNQVLGNNKNNIKRLNEAGIKNFSELSKLDPKKKIEGLKDETKIKLINQAKLQINAHTEGVIKFKFIEENFALNKGFNLLPEPAPGDLFRLRRGTRLCLFRKIRILIWYFL